MARFHTDEHVPSKLVRALRQLGHDVLTAREAGRADRKLPDDQVLAFAAQGGRAVITFNHRDFRREHARRAGRHAGIVSCTDDKDYVALAGRIHGAVSRRPILDGLLIRVVRPAVKGTPAAAPGKPVAANFFPNEPAVYSPKQEKERLMTNEPMPATSIPGAAPENAPQAAVELPPTILIDDFVKIELRVGTVLEAKPAPKGDKLLVLQVDLGTEKRQVMAGIRQHYAPEQLVGKQIVVVANLAPRQMMGLTSQGMLLAAHDAQTGKVIVLSPSDAVAPGSKVS